MNPASVESMVGPAVVCILMSICAIRNWIPIPLGLLIALLRILFCASYFTWWGAETYSALDDVTYFKVGVQLAEDPAFRPVTPAGQAAFMSEVQSEHFVFYLWVGTISWLFGPYYHAGVFFNVFFNFVGASALMELSSSAGFTRRYSQCLGLSYLLYWETVSWTSFVLLKDPMVSALTLVCLRILSRPLRPLADLIQFLLCTVLLLHTRFYIPPMLFLAFALSSLAKSRHLVLWGLPLTLAGAFFIRVANVPHIDPSYAPFGAARYLLTPVPGFLDPGKDYGYLALPAILNWWLFLPTMYGLVLLAREAPKARLCLIYSVLVWALYSLSPELNGPRQRFQISFVFCWGLYHWLVSQWRALSHVSPKPH